MRIYRKDPDEFALEATPPPVFRDEKLRELVDALPAREQHLVSRVFFGGDTVTQAAAEIQLEPAAAKVMLEHAMERLRDALSETD